MLKTIDTITVELNPGARAHIMTRDMELIRRILTEIKSRKTTELAPLQLDYVEDWALARHVEMLMDAGLIEGIKSTPLHGLPTIAVRDLTWEGHDFAATIENDTVWGTMKSKLSAKELASMPLSIMKTLGFRVLEQYLATKLGL